MRAERLLVRREAAISAVRRAETLANAHGGRVVIFGSLAEGGFHERSDVDVAVCGLPPTLDSQVAAEIDTLLTLAGFTADVVPERFLGSSLQQRIARHGREPSTLG